MLNVILDKMCMKMESEIIHEVMMIMFLCFAAVRWNQQTKSWNNKWNNMERKEINTSVTLWDVIRPFGPPFAHHWGQRLEFLLDNFLLEEIRRNLTSNAQPFVPYEAFLYSLAVFSHRLNFSWSSRNSKFHNKTNFDEHSNVLVWNNSMTHSPDSTWNR